MDTRNLHNDTESIFKSFLPDSSPPTTPPPPKDIPPTMSVKEYDQQYSNNNSCSDNSCDDDERPKQPEQPIQKINKQSGYFGCSVFNGLLLLSVGGMVAYGAYYFKKRYS